jgi:hypothetical protein
MRQNHEKYTYRAIWSEEDQEHVGLCDQLPSLSWIAEKHDEAMAGITQLVADLIRDQEEDRSVGIGSH